MGQAPAGMRDGGPARRCRPRRMRRARPGWRPRWRWLQASGMIGPRQTIRLVICATHTALRRWLGGERPGQPGPGPQRPARRRSASGRRPGSMRRPCRNESPAGTAPAPAAHRSPCRSARRIRWPARAARASGPSTASSSAAVGGDDDGAPGHRCRHRRASRRCRPRAARPAPAAPASRGWRHRSARAAHGPARPRSTHAKAAAKTRGCLDVKPRTEFAQQPCAPPAARVSSRKQGSGLAPGIAPQRRQPARGRHARRCRQTAKHRLKIAPSA